MNEHAHAASRMTAFHVSPSWPAGEASELIVVENFFEELKAKVGN